MQKQRVTGRTCHAPSYIRAAFGGLELSPASNGAPIDAATGTAAPFGTAPRFRCVTNRPPPRVGGTQLGAQRRLPHCIQLRCAPHLFRVHQTAHLLWGHPDRASSVGRCRTTIVSRHDARRMGMLACKLLSETFKHRSDDRSKRSASGYGRLDERRWQVDERTVLAKDESRSWRLVPAAQGLAASSSRSIGLRTGSRISPYAASACSPRFWLRSVRSRLRLPVGRKTAQANRRLLTASDRDSRA